MPELPYRDAALPVDVRVADLLARMTLDEKAALMFHPAIVVGEDGELSEGEPGLGVASTEHTLGELGVTHYNLLGAADDSGALARWYNTLQRRAAATRLGIPVTVSSDPRNHFTDNPATAALAGAFSQWPEPIGLAALRSPERVREFADIVRQEYTAVGLRVALHPQLDLATEPRWARISATFGEDADLASELGVAYLEGLHGTGELGRESVAAMIKHFPGGGPQKDGEDAHFSYGREQVYPGDAFDYHLRPFRAAIAAGATQVMPYYGMPVGTKYPERGFAFDREIITDLLRGDLGFTGIVCSDWGILTDSSMMGEPLVARAWGVEDLTPSERAELAILAGCDQFGGENEPSLVADLVRAGRVTEDRIDQSARRLLTEKFRLGLFDNPYVDEERASTVVGSAPFQQRGDAAQRDSITLLTNPSDLLPLSSGARIYVEGIDAALASRYATVVASPDEADVALIRLKAPFEHREGFFESIFHSGSLEFSEADRAEHAELLRKVPTVVDLYLDRPAVIPELAAHAGALLANYGSDDAALLDIVFGVARPIGRLPFDLPSSMAAVLESREDVPFDTKDPLFPFGHGLAYLRSGDQVAPASVTDSTTVVAAKDAVSDAISPTDQAGPVGAASAAGAVGPAGTWDLAVETPVGTQPVPLVIRGANGRFEGELAGNPISDVATKDGSVSFRASLSKPFPVKIRVRAEVEGDRIHGTAKATMLPLSLSFTGSRVRP